MRRLLILSFAALVGCAAGDSSETASEQAVTGTIRYKSTMCFGWCPVTDVMASTDGSVSFSGFRPMRGGEGPDEVSVTYTLPPEQVSALIERLEAEGFADLLDSYNDNDVCGQLATDGPSKIITVTSPLLTKSVNYYTHCWDFADQEKLTAMIADVEETLKVNEKIEELLPVE